MKHPHRRIRLSARSPRSSCALPALAASASSAPAPDFTLASRAGKPVKLAAVKGQVVMINFWATWCGPCRQEMPLLESIHKKYKQDGLHPARRERRAGFEGRGRVARRRRL